MGKDEKRCDDWWRDSSTGGVYFAGLVAWVSSFAILYIPLLACGANIFWDDNGELVNTWLGGWFWIGTVLSPMFSFLSVVFVVTLSRGPAVGMTVRKTIAVAANAILGGIIPAALLWW